MSKQKIYTIGHSNHTLEKFLDLLKAHRIELVIDVRSAPYSRYRPHFNKKALEQSLTSESIGYVFLGDRLGGRPKDASCYTNGKVDYQKLANSSSFKNGIDKLLELASQKKLAVMCAEKEPLNCHRTFLVCKELKKHEIIIKHILADGSLKDQSEIEKQLEKPLF